MSSLTNQYLEELEIAKQDIKTALEEKGVSPSGGYASYAEAIDDIYIPKIQESATKDIDANGSYSINADSGYNAIGEVTVNVNIPPYEPEYDTLVLTIEENGSHWYYPHTGFPKWDKAHITTRVEPKVQDKTMTITRNGVSSIFPDTGYDGLSSVEITVDVASSGGGGETGKPKIPNGFKFTGGDMSLIDWSAYDWGSVYDFGHFFENCTASDPSWTVAFGEHVINTQTEPISFECMFVGSNFTTLDLSTWDTSKVFSMSGLCLSCKQLQYIDISGWDYSGLLDSDDAILNMNETDVLCDEGTSLLFEGCSSLKTIVGDVYIRKKQTYSYYGSTTNNLNTGKGVVGDTKLTTIPNYIFEQGAPAYRLIPTTVTDLTPVANWDASKLASLKYLFYDIDIDLSLVSDWDTSNVESLYGMLYCRNGYAKSRNLEAIAGWDTSKVKDMSYLFFGIKNYDFSALNNWDTSSVTNMSYLFNNVVTTEPMILPFDSWDTSNVDNISYMFGKTSNIPKIIELDMSNWFSPTGYSMSNCFDGNTYITKVVGCKPTSLYNTFSNCRYLTEVELDMSYMTNNTLSYTFYNCTNLKKLTMKGDPSKITSFTNWISNNSGAIFYYDSRYDYSTIISKLGSNWTATPI